ncbi:MAG TPA: sodium:proton symporter [Alphaproteobacteria bacterium]|nr:sodium:proton symporter [Alphaproteobacteria bacterium]
MPLLAFFGRFATLALPAGLLIGLLVPGLAASARPLLTPTVFALLLVALLRLDLGRIAAHLRQPGRLLLGVLWMQFATVLPMAGLLALWPALKPLELPLLVYAASPPILSAVAYAVLLRLDAALALVLLLLCTFLSPLVLPPLLFALMGLEIALGVGEVMLRLALLIGGAVLGALLVRRLAGLARIEGWAQEINGAVVVIMTVFAIAVMDGVADRLLAEPALVLGISALVFAVNLALQALGGLAFLVWPPRSAATAMLMSGNRNMGLLMAALGEAADGTLFLYFALAQLPIYILPGLMRPLYERLIAARGVPAAE